MPKPALVNSSTIFISSLIVIPVVTIIVYLSGLQNHRSLYFNSLLSVGILSFVLMLFITTGLFQGWKMKDNIGIILSYFKHWEKYKNDLGPLNFDAPFDVAENLEGCFVSFLLWLILSLFGAVILWTLGAVVWITVLLLAAILYWIVFRAFRLVFKNSPGCKGNLTKSIITAIVYTALYNCWIFAIIFISHYLNS